MIKKNLVVAILLSFLFALSAAASPGQRHADDENYRGAVTLLAAGHVKGAKATYSTLISINNASDHPVFLKVELYGTNGYREGIVDVHNPILEHSQERKLTWGIFPEYTTAVGELIPASPSPITEILGEGIGAVRVVAVRPDGSEDPTATIYGFGRLIIEPASGGRMSERYPGLTDYEAARGTLPYTPFRRGDARINLFVINFEDRDHMFRIPESTASVGNGPTITRPAGDVFTVPARSTRLVPFPHFQWHPNVQSPDILGIASLSGCRSCQTYATLIDPTTNHTQVIFDYITTESSMHH